MYTINNFATVNLNSMAKTGTTLTYTITAHVIYITMNLATIVRPKGYIFIITMCVTKAAEPPCTPHLEASVIHLQPPGSQQTSGHLVCQL